MVSAKSARPRGLGGVEALSVICGRPSAGLRGRAPEKSSRPLPCALITESGAAGRRSGARRPPAKPSVTTMQSAETATKRHPCGVRCDPLSMVACCGRVVLHRRGQAPIHFVNFNAQSVKHSSADECLTHQRTWRDGGGRNIKIIEGKSENRYRFFSCYLIYYCVIPLSVRLSPFRCNLTSKSGILKSE